MDWENESWQTWLKSPAKLLLRWRRLEKTVADENMMSVSTRKPYLCCVLEIVFQCFRDHFFSKPVRLCSLPLQCLHQITKCCCGHIPPSNCCIILIDGLEEHQCPFSTINTFNTIVWNCCMLQWADLHISFIACGLFTVCVYIYVRAPCGCLG